MKREKKIIIGLVIALVVALCFAGYMLFLRDTPTAVLTDTNESLQDADKTNQLAVKMNPSIIVEEGTMQNINFYNLNKNRLLKLIIAVDGEKIYESDFIEPGKIMKADVIDENKLEKEETEAVAEIYSYSLEKEHIGQTNVEITLTK